MSKTSDRLTPLTPDALSGEAKAFYDAVVESPRTQGPGAKILIRDDGSLCGPFDAWLRSPGIGVHFEKAGMALRQDTSMDAGVREVAVLTVARAWHMDFEFQVHSLAAKMAGVPDDVIAHIARGDAPTTDRDDLKVAYAIARELVYQRRVTDGTYADALRILGERDTIEVVTHVGFYQLVSGVLTTFHVPDPSVDIAAPHLDDSAQGLPIDLYEAASTTRAVRKLRPDPVSDDQLARALKLASFAPSGGNRQPWQVILVKDPDKKKQLGDLYAPRWAKYAEAGRTALAGIPEDKAGPTVRALAAGDHLSDNFAQIPVICVFIFNPQLLHITDLGKDRPSVVGGGSIYPAVQNFLLGCRAEGLGCTLTTLLCECEDQVSNILDIPDGWGTAAFVPVGHAVGRGHGPLSRRSIDHIAHTDQFGTPFVNSN